MGLSLEAIPALRFNPCEAHGIFAAIGARCAHDTIDATPL
jgi:hypothetical protein